MLSQTSEYALRLMAYLAQQPAGAFVRAIAMDGKVKVPANYRAKTLNQLDGVGLLESTRGRADDFRLSRPADRSRLVDIVAPFEPVAGPRTCLLGRAQSQNTVPCGAAHDGWLRLGEAREQYLRGTTIAYVAC